MKLRGITTIVALSSSAERNPPKPEEHHLPPQLDSDNLQRRRMTIYHRALTPERWAKLSLFEQLANVGSEIERAISWKNKGNREHSRLAFLRGLELLDLTLATTKSGARLKELARLRETLADYFAGHNQYHSSDRLWRNYFHAFHYAARKDR